MSSPPNSAALSCATRSASASTSMPSTAGAPMIAQAIPSMPCHTHTICAAVRLGKLTVVAGTHGNAHGSLGQTQVMESLQDACAQVAAPVRCINTQCVSCHMLYSRGSWHEACARSVNWSAHGAAGQVHYKAAFNVLKRLGYLHSMILHALQLTNAATAAARRQKNPTCCGKAQGTDVCSAPCAPLQQPRQVL